MVGGVLFLAVAVVGVAVGVVGDGFVVFGVAIVDALGVAVETGDLVMDVFVVVGVEVVVVDAGDFVESGFEVVGVVAGDLAETVFVPGVVAVVVICLFADGVLACDATAFVFVGATFVVVAVEGVAGVVGVLGFVFVCV